MPRLKRRRRTYTYEYSKKYDGATVTILNAGDIYNMRAEIDREELTGDSLDDVMFNRCRKVENELNVKLEEHTAGVDGELANTGSEVDHVWRGRVQHYVHSGARSL